MSDFPPHLRGLSDAAYVRALVSEPAIDSVFLRVLGRRPTRKEFRGTVEALVAAVPDPEAVGDTEAVEAALRRVYGPGPAWDEVAQTLAFHTTTLAAIGQLEPNQFFADGAVTTALLTLDPPLRERAHAVRHPAYTLGTSSILSGYARPTPSGGRIVLLHGGTRLVAAFCLHVAWSIERYDREARVLGRETAGARERARFCSLARECLGYGIAESAKAEVEQAVRVLEEEFDEAEVGDIESTYVMAELALAFILLHEFGHVLLDHPLGAETADLGLEEEADDFAVGLMERAGILQVPGWALLVQFLASVCRAEAYAGITEDAAAPTHPTMQRRLRRLITNARALEQPQRTFLERRVDALIAAAAAIHVLTPAG